MTRGEPVETRASLPDNAVPLFSIEITRYLRENGKPSWFYHISGPAERSEVIMMLEEVKFSLLADEMGLSSE